MHRQDMLTLNDLQLLEIELDLLWGAQAGPELVLACAREGVRVRLGKHVPPELARALAAEIDGAQPVVDSNTPSPQLERWRILLEDALGAAVRLAPGSGPSYVIHPDVTSRASAELVRSDANDLAALRGANPGNWGADEWHRLLDDTSDRGSWPGTASAFFRSAIRRRPTRARLKRASGHTRSSADRVTQRRRPRNGRRCCGQVVACCSTAPRGRIAPRNALRPVLACAGLVTCGSSNQ